MNAKAPQRESREHRQQEPDVGPAGPDDLATNSVDAATSKAAAVVSKATARLAERDHEVRAALFAIEIAAAGLSRHRDQMTAGQVDELIDGLAAETRRVRALVRGDEVAMTTLDLGDTIAPVLACARAAGLDVRSSVGRGVLVVGRADSTAQIMVALLDNVRQHAPSSPVDVTVTLHHDAATLTVADRGPGIDPLVLSRIFECNAHRADSAGLGLGLYVARRLMEEQGGSIAVRSVPGTGAEFVLEFRRA